MPVIKNLNAEWRSGFKGTAANDAGFPTEDKPAPAAEPEYLSLLRHMDETIPETLAYFDQDMRTVLGQMNIDKALAEQSGMLNDQKLNGDRVESDELALQCWLAIPLAIWDALLESYRDHLWWSDNARYHALYEGIGPDAINHYLETGTHKNAQAVRAVFGNALTEEMTLLHVIKSTLSEKIPHLDIACQITPFEDTHVIPTLLLRAHKGYELRLLLRDYIEGPRTTARPRLTPL